MSLDTHDEEDEDEEDVEHEVDRQQWKRKEKNAKKMAQQKSDEEGEDDHMWDQREGSVKIPPATEIFFRKKKKKQGSEDQAEERSEEAEKEEIIDDQSSEDKGDNLVQEEEQQREEKGGKSKSKKGKIPFFRKKSKPKVAWESTTSDEWVPGGEGERDMREENEEDDNGDREDFEREERNGKEKLKLEWESEYPEAHSTLRRGSSVDEDNGRGRRIAMKYSDGGQQAVSEADEEGNVEEEKRAKHNTNLGRTKSKKQASFIRTASQLIRKASFSKESKDKSPKEDKKAVDPSKKLKRHTSADNLEWSVEEEMAIEEKLKTKNREIVPKEEIEPESPGRSPVTNDGRSRSEDLDSMFGRSKICRSDPTRRRQPNNAEARTSHYRKESPRTPQDLRRINSTDSGTIVHTHFEEIFLHCLVFLYHKQIRRGWHEDQAFKE